MQKERWKLAFKWLLIDAQVEEESLYENTGIGNEATTVGIGEYLTDNADLPIKKVWEFGTELTHVVLKRKQLQDQATLRSGSISTKMTNVV